MEELKAFDKVLADISKITEEGNFLPECSTKEGYEASKKFVLKVTTPARTALANAHKEAKAYYLKKGRKIDSMKNDLMSQLEAIQLPHQQAYKAVDDKKKRIKEAKENAIQNGFNELNQYIERAFNQSSEMIDDLITECGSFDLSEEVFDKRLPEIINLQSTIIGKLTDAYTQALQFEELNKQKEALAAQQAALDAKEKEQRDKEEAQQKIEQEAQQREDMRKEAEEIASVENTRLKLEAEESQAILKAVQIKAEEDIRLAAKKAATDELERQQNERVQAQAEAARLEADKSHSRSVKKKAFNCLVKGGIDSAQAKLVINLIAANEIDGISITY